VDLLVRAFADDPLFGHFADTAALRHALFAHQVRSGLRMLYRSGPACKAVALWEEPGSQGISIRQGLLDLRAAVGLVRALGIRRTADLAAFNAWATELRHRLTGGPHWHLVLLASDPAQRGRGHAWSLVRPVLEEAGRTGVAAYLETHNAVNVERYRGYGFDVVAEEAVPGTAVVQRCMLWRPARRPCPSSAGGPDRRE
jgi:ribosomal protein S18 acetylase RimI-like enzyme